MNPTMVDWLFLSVFVLHGIMIVYLRHLIRGIEKRTDVLERETEWIKHLERADKPYDRYNHSIVPLILTMPAVVDDQEYTKSVPLRFVEGDEEEGDPLPGLPKRYG